MISGKEWLENYPSLLEENRLRKKKMKEKKRRAARVFNSESLYLIFFILVKFSNNTYSSFMFKRLFSKMVLNYSFEKKLLETIILKLVWKT